MAEKAKAKPKSGGRSAKSKGNRGEEQIVEALTALGLPSQRVLGSGAMRGAVSDVKVGVRLNPDGSMPEKDEAQGVMRVECKNRKDNPDFHSQLTIDNIFALLVTTKQGQEILWKHLDQDAITKAVIMKRAKTPYGALKAGKYNECFGVFMGLADFAALLRAAYPDRVVYVDEKVPK